MMLAQYWTLHIVSAASHCYRHSAHHSHNFCPFHNPIALPYILNLACTSDKPLQMSLDVSYMATLQPSNTQSLRCNLGS